jgi:uncharacterized protein (DUF952 family)
MQDVVYKILTTPQWQLLQSTGTFEGSPDDLRDGFIHLSTAEQLAGTLEKHFAGQSGLVCVSMRSRDLGTALRWEPSRGGLLFPHLYSSLALSAVMGQRPCSSLPTAATADADQQA